MEFICPGSSQCDRHGSPTERSDIQRLCHGARTIAEIDLRDAVVDSNLSFIEKQLKAWSALAPNKVISCFIRPCVYILIVRTRIQFFFSERTLHPLALRFFAFNLVNFFSLAHWSILLTTKKAIKNNFPCLIDQRRQNFYVTFKMSQFRVSHIHVIELIRPKENLLYAKRDVWVSSNRGILGATLSHWQFTVRWQKGRKCGEAGSVSPSGAIAWFTAPQVWQAAE